jgi:uncharacterized protein YjbJ (UPF0337 family)
VAFHYRRAERINIDFLAAFSGARTRRTVQGLTLKCVSAHTQPGAFPRLSLYLRESRSLRTSAVTTGAEYVMSNASHSNPAADSGTPVSLPSSDAMKGQWKQRLGAAKLTWGKLTDDDLLQLEGRGEKLAGLAQERYARTLETAARQVKIFYDKHFS